MININSKSVSLGILENILVSETNIKNQWIVGNNEYCARKIEYKSDITVKPTSIVYGRVDVKYTKVNDEIDNYDWIKFFAHGGSWDIKTILLPTPDIEYLNQSNISRFTQYTGESPLCSFYGGEFDNWENKTLYTRNVIVCDLTRNNLYTKLQELGMTDDEIKSYLDSIPFFEDSVNLDIITSQVTMSCDTEDAVIHYTIDGSEPTEYSPIYTKPFYMGGDHVVKAIGYKDGYESSNIANVKVDVTSKPHITYKNGTYEGKVTLINESSNRLGIAFEEPNSLYRITSADATTYIDETLEGDTYCYVYPLDNSSNRMTCYVYHAVISSSSTDEQVL